MKRLESNLLNMALSLTLISLVAAGALGGVYILTKEPIEKTNEANKLKAKTEVLPSFCNLTFAQPVEVEQDGYVMTIHHALDANGQAVGAAVETSDKNGFNGLIKLMIGFNNDGEIQGYSVLEQGETPGLGANMVSWFKTDKNRQSVLGLNPSAVKLEVSKDGGDVDAITAATISSRAFLRAVQRAYNAYSEQSQLSPLDGVSSATALAADSLAADSLVVEEDVVAEVFESQPVQNAQQTPQPVQTITIEPKPATPVVQEVKATVKEAVKEVEKVVEEVSEKAVEKVVEKAVEMVPEKAENVDSADAQPANLPAAEEEGLDE